MAMVEELIKKADPRSFADVEEASRIIKCLGEISQLVVRGQNCEREEETENMIDCGGGGEGGGRDREGDRARGGERIEEGTLGMLVDKILNVVPLLNEKNWRILALFSDFPSLSLPLPLPLPSSLRTPSHSNTAIEAATGDDNGSIRGRGRERGTGRGRGRGSGRDSITFGLQNVISSLFLISAGRDCILNRHTTAVSESSDPSEVTHALGDILLRTFCSGSAVSRIALLSTVLSPAARTQPSGYNTRILDLHGDEDSTLLLSQYFKNESFSVPVWAVKGTAQGVRTGEGRTEETERCVPAEDVFAVCSRTLCTPSFIHALMHFGVMDGNRVRNVKVPWGRGRERGSGRGHSDTGGGGGQGEGGDCTRQTTHKREEEASRLAVRLKSLSLNLLDSLMQCALSQIEMNKRTFERPHDSVRERSSPSQRGTGSSSSKALDNFTSGFSQSWCHVLPLLKLLEWRSYREDKQGDMQGKGSVFGQSALSLFIQELEDDSNSSSSNSSSSSSSSVLNKRGSTHDKSRSSAYGRAMVLGIFHVLPSVRASSALRLRHELSGLRAPCEATARHTHEYALTSTSLLCMLIYGD